MNSSYFYTGSYLTWIVKMSKVVIKNYKVNFLKVFSEETLE